MAKRSTDNKNDCLGEVQCLDCGGPEYVYRSKRRGGHLYGRCPDCGINQKTGPRAQARFAAFVPVGELASGNGEPPKPARSPEPEPESLSLPAPSGHSEPLPHPVLTNPADKPKPAETAPAPDPVPEPTETKPGFSFGGLFFGLLLILMPAAALAFRGK